MKELRKYLERFGLVLLVAVLIILFVMGKNNVETMFYKICLVTVGWGVADLLWLVFFKRWLGRMEDLAKDDRQAIFIFRGILYAATIVALTLGL